MKKQIREIRIVDLIKYLLIPSLTVAAIWICFGIFVSSETGLLFGILLAVSVILTYFLAKYALIGLVLLYKAFAPLSMRDQCRFEPTCSTYMIMALKKYGAVVGLIKGIRRIARCHPPNGGVDYP